ncbi:hypothetical protein K443DRAFT_11584 [Laccaria amethystina LaAM-08-1]|uniref:Uncharacterized protein n=1 Tax=Laccaria amethystina LaAM-08-1 TaxID=1095629 RepID=A0A0C9XG74_9AGAR|nr:hypothetical protein K443DRAFT_11584 [Laccaria amethystina LaAM-08-1]
MSTVDWSPSGKQRVSVRRMKMPQPSDAAKNRWNRCRNNQTPYPTSLPPFLRLWWAVVIPNPYDAQSPIHILSTSNPVQVSAAPIRVLLVTSSISTATNNSPTFERLRFGHPEPSWASWRKQACPASPSIVNFFRAAFGWPFKEPAFHHRHGKHHDDHDHQHHGKHHHHKGPEGKHGGPSAAVFTHHGKFAHQATSFGMRLHRALMSLGPWEGRAMDFVLGCGIGVLLRMFWVFAVVMIHVVGGNRISQYTPVPVRAEDLMVPPPNYVFEDVKTPVVVGDVKTPVVVEEVKKTTEDESK